MRYDWQFEEHAGQHFPDQLDEARLPSPAIPFPHGRVACPACQAHNDAHNLLCVICGAVLPGNLPRVANTPGDQTAHHIHIPRGASPRPSLGSRDRTRLTAREWEVARLVAHGHSDDDVASALAIRPATVHNHLMRVFQKTGVHRRVELARWVEEQGEQEISDMR